MEVFVLENVNYTLRKIFRLNRLLFFFLIFICILTAIYAVTNNKEDIKLKIYVTDAEMMRLIPIDTYTKADTPKKQAKYVIARLTEGFDDNPKIRRTIPKISGGMRVKVKDDTAYVNISDKLVENHPQGRDLESLTVYSVVNSLLSIDGIKKVRFTIDGKIQKKFMGYMDMREIFTEKEIL